MAGVFKTKTLIIWNPYYNPDFAWNTLPPDVRHITYFTEDTYGLTSDRLVAEVQDLIETGTIEDAKYAKLRTSVVSKPPVKRIEVSHPVVSSVKNRVVLPQKSRIHVRPIILNPRPETSAIMNFDGSGPVVLCVLKSGSRDFNVQYVVHLRNMLARHTTIPYRFVCLTDMEIDPSICKTLPLQSNLTGWWSKLELFLPNQFDSKHIVYFDLDTVIIKNIDAILQLETDFAALGGWIPGPNRNSAENFGSGMMIWKNDGKLTFLYDEFENALYKHGDQEYIVKKLVEHNIVYQTLQNITSGIYSYKRNCLKGVPQDARIICFHGKPRPHEAANLTRWVRSYWR
jgi:hypothetical protein